MLNKKGFLLIESLILLQCIFVITSLVYLLAIQNSRLKNIPIRNHSAKVEQEMLFIYRDQKFSEKLVEEEGLDAKETRVYHD